MLKRSPVIPPPLEREVQRDGIIFLQSRGWFIKRRNTGMMTAEHKGKKRAVRFSEPGASDTYGLLPDGRHFELEFKRLDERPRLDQTEWMIEWCSRGAVAFWVDCVKFLSAIVPALESGGIIVYEGGIETYRVRKRGITAEVTGPTSNYYIVKGRK